MIACDSIIEPVDSTCREIEGWTGQLRDGMGD